MAPLTVFEARGLWGFKARWPCALTLGLIARFNSSVPAPCSKYEALLVALNEFYPTCELNCYDGV